MEEEWRALEWLGEDRSDVRMTLSSLRYYLNKFKVSPEDKEFVNKVVAAYVTGLCWVLRYYYQVSIERSMF